MRIAGTRDPAGATADVDAGCGCHRRSHLCGGDRRSRAVPIVEGSGGTFWFDAKEISVWRDRCDRTDLEDRRCQRAHGALRSGECHPDQASEGLFAEELGDAAGGSARGCARRRWRWHASSRSCCIGCWWTARRSAPRRQRPLGHRQERRNHRFGRTRHQLARSRSRRRDDGSGQAVNRSVRPKGRARVVRLVGRSSSDTIRWRSKRRPRTEERHRRQDQLKKGLTPNGPLQKSGFSFDETPTCCRPRPRRPAINVQRPPASMARGPSRRTKPGTRPELSGARQTHALVPAAEKHDMQDREVGGGRAPRQPGQVRKEAAAVSFRPGRSSGLPPFDRHAPGGRRGG